jgi:endonuclease YncB( thermonuclease family)
MITIHKIPEYSYDDCTVLNWVDGDTLDMDVRAHFDMGFKVKITGQYTGRFRLYGIDAFERREPLGPAATAFALRKMPVGSAVCARTFRDPDNFGRYLATLWLPGFPEETINAELVSIGFAVERYW